MLPENYAAIVSFLTRHGYTRLAAAGIAGNIYRESMGNPESVGTGGGGLIGWTPLPAGMVTGNPAADLRTQLAALLTYNQQWSQYIPTLNAATSATQAADIYMNYFERPGIPAAYEREAAAQAVATACGIT
jgi:Phage tail lysozyme